MACALTKVRGDASIGTLLENVGLHSVPSNFTPTQPNMDDKWFSGGYTTRKYVNATVRTVQLELPTHMRFKEEDRNVSVPKLSLAIIKLIEIWSGTSRYRSYTPSLVPSKRPSLFPSMNPSGFPSGVPSVEPSRNPSDLPNIFPSNIPPLSSSMEPSNNPSQSPSICVDKDGMKLGKKKKDCDWAEKKIGRKEKKYAGDLQNQRKVRKEKGSESGVSNLAGIVNNEAR